MARSTNIYIVTDTYRDAVAAFTVKHECIRYLENRNKQCGLNFLLVARVPDGRASDAIEYIDADTFRLKG